MDSSAWCARGSFGWLRLGAKLKARRSIDHGETPPLWGGVCVRGSMVALAFNFFNMTNWIIGLVVVAALVIGGGYYAMSGGYSMEDKMEVANGEPTDEMNGDSTEANKATPKLAEGAAKFNGSFFDLATRGGNYACDISSTGVSNDTKGTVYVSGTTVRGDFTSTVGGSAMESHMLKLDDSVYVWGGGLEQGIVMKATAMTGSDSPATQGTGVSGTQEYGWDCRATGSDASMFVKPSNIEFMDLSVMMQGAGMMPATGR